MAPRRIEAEQILDLLPPGGVVWVQAAAVQSRLVDAGLAHRPERAAGLTMTGIFIPGVNRCDALLAGGRRVRSFFMTPELRRAGGAVELLPLCYRDIGEHLRTARIDAAVFMVAPPDRDGLCSFGPAVDFLAELWPRIPLRIAHVNPAVPRTRGHPGIPFAALDAVLEGDAPLLAWEVGADPASDAIARHIAALVPDGATVQAGIGRVPERAMAALADHRRLRLHGGLVGEAAVDLLHAGAVAPEHPIVTGLALGTERLYAAVAGPEFEFRPVSHTHAVGVLAALPDLVTINSALEIDLLGQAYSELLPSGLNSGPGGAPDFAAGAHVPGALRIIGLPATAGGRGSRIVGPNGGRGPVCLTRFGIDAVVTENGVADLRGKGHDARAEALIAIADPAHRPALAESWDAWRRAASMS